MEPADTFEPTSPARAAPPAWEESAVPRVLGAFALACAVVCVYAMRRADPDLFGYLAYGRLLVEHGRPIDGDPFAYTPSGYHWVTFEHLAHILIWEAYRLGGPLGLLALKCLVGGSAVYLLFAGLRTTSADSTVWVPVFVLATSMLSRYFLFRPQLFSFAFFAVYAWVLIRFLLGRSGPPWVLPVVMLAWVNLHGGFLAGLGLLCLAIALRVCQNANVSAWGRGLFTGTRPLSIALVASILVTFINPQGWRLWSYVLTEILHSTNRRYIDEWRPTLQVGDHWTAITLILLTAGLAVVGWLGHKHLLLVGGLRPWQWVLGCAPLVVMAFWSVRHVPISTIWIAPVVALLASNLKARLPGGHFFHPCWSVVASLACIPAILTFYVVWLQPWPRIDVSGDTLGSKHPCTAVAFMRQRHLNGNIYNPLWWGSYITWQLYPRVLVSMDGRNISAFPDNMVVENLRFYSDSASRVDLEAPLRYKTDFLLVPSDRPVLYRVLADSRWYKVFSDRDSALFVRADRKRLVNGPLPDGRGSDTPGRSCPDFLE
jgi:hypothetical protein